MWRRAPLGFLAGCWLSQAAARKDADHCTGFAVGPKAAVDGASMVGQTDDGEGGPGTSILFVPAAQHMPGSVRPVIDQETRQQIGEIPQVPYTFAYSYGAYGIMNEHKVAIGESTCSSRIVAKSLANNGTALFSNEELSRIALERCTTARCAVLMMGDMAVNHGGFYGEDSEVNTGGEALMVADPTEAWVFHILADPSGESAIWAAQRVPDDHVAFVPNTYVIREMELTSSDFLLSLNAHTIARKFGWWSGTDDSKFNFAGAFSLGEYANPYYSARRMWRAYSLLAPSLGLGPQPEITDLDAGYPFSIKPDKLLAPQDIFKVLRDYLEGTAFSLVEGPAAGPFNSPLRLADGDAAKKVPTGAWERPISIYRADYAVVSVCYPTGHGIVWVAPHTAHASVFAPVWTSAATEVPRQYQVERSKGVDRQSLFWAASAVSNWAYGTMFSKAILDIRAAQESLEPKAKAFAESLRLSDETGPAQSRRLADHAVEVLGAWWDLFFDLMGKYNDGYVVTYDGKGGFTSTAVGYPEWYLKAVGFDHAVPAPNSSFARLAQRMGDAAAVMAKIDAARKKPSSLASGFTTVI